jgi:hypothetical protein
MHQLGPMCLQAETMFPSNDLVKFMFGMRHDKQLHIIHS